MRFSQKILFTLTIITLGLTMYSCQVKEVQVSEIKSFNILNIDDKYVTIDITAKVNNPNNFSFTISKVNLNVTFNKVDLGTINKVQSVRIKKKSNEIQHLIFKLELKQIMKGSMLFIPSLLTNRAKIKIKGYIKASKFPFGKKIDIDYNKTTQISKDFIK